MYRNEVATPTPPNMKNAPTFWFGAFFLLNALLAYRHQAGIAACGGGIDTQRTFGQQTLQLNVGIALRIA
ncbi:hypothetical protein PBNK5_30680 [Pectobacterium brasiliense]